ncbi:cytochrome P450 [Nocardia yamanashiensis]|uniref:cytochrome P450 n=1 Tax=Nocardia yamanashiensis TaxID=209247 RepID=UPI001E4BCC55|nr:cytochrome P450 [Nocardia yamanashiensis]UGT45407.1 cytochrome P450 [Nocardia yamanashiensis]
MRSIFDAAFARDPWDVLRELRDDGGVHRVSTPDGPPAWLVTRYPEVRAGLLDERLSTNLRYAGETDYRGFAVPPPLDVFQNSEPDQLARLRGAVVGELRRAGEWGERAGELIAPWLHTLDDAPEFDFVDRVALPLPGLLLGELLGLSPAQRTALAEWANTTLRPDARPRARDTLQIMQRVITGALAQGRTDGDATMLGRLVHSGDPGETAGLLFYLLFVWYEVLMDVLAGAVHAFAARPDELAALRAATDPTTAVDELLRFLSPQVLAGPRFARTDLELSGHTVRAGETVLLCLAAANHDPEIFDAPGKLNVRRNPNPQLALGHGAHACVGNALVRPVIGAVLKAIYDHWPAPRIAVDAQSIPWRSGFRHRGPLSLPVAVSRMGRAASIAPS